MASVQIVAVSPLENCSLDELVSPIMESFKVNVKACSHQIVDASFAFDISRNQFYSTLLLSALTEKFSSSADKILGLTSVDLFVPVLTYVFGEAQFDGKSAIVSTHRLHESFYGLNENPHLTKSRVIKEAIHELGHTFGLPHCHDYLCVMHSSTGVEEIDLKTKRFCHACEKLVLQKVKLLDLSAHHNGL
ncbi:MAG: archaemetzincin family Zn-dependent metalloprotease [Candidatus Kryptoniota bacterium]